MTKSVNIKQNRRFRRMMVGGVAVMSLTVACSAENSSGASISGAADTQVSAVAASTKDSELFDSSVVHSISLDYDQTAYEAMIATFVASGAKEWITATVTIDGTVFENVGIKLKGNSTLRGLSSGSSTTTPATATPATTDAAETDSATTDAAESDAVATTAAVPDAAAPDAAAGPEANRGRNRGGMGGDISADEPEGLPWRIRLDKYVDGQNYKGETDIVVRGGNTETSMNEAVALELIGAAGLATEEAVSSRFTVNGSAESLRLVIQNPTDEWDEENFDSDGILYKAEAGGDYSYRGDDAASYTDVFSVEASSSGEDDYAPLADFLKFVNESDDATFAAVLGSHLDIAAFAKYLAIQDLVANTDDIDGPGNNSYLRYDAETKAFTVVAWDQNLSFSSMGGGGMGGDGNPGGGNFGANPGGGNFGGGQGGRPGGMGGDNILVERLKANTDFAKLYETAVTDLRAELYASGTAQTILDAWTSVLTAQAADLVPVATITAEAQSISGQFTTS